MTKRSETRRPFESKFGGARYETPEDVGAISAVWVPVPESDVEIRFPVAELPTFLADVLAILGCRADSPEEIRRDLAGYVSR